MNPQPDLVLWRRLDLTNPFGSLIKLVNLYITNIDALKRVESRSLFTFVSTPEASGVTKMAAELPPPRVVNSSLLVPVTLFRVGP